MSPHSHIGDSASSRKSCHMTVIRLLVGAAMLVTGFSTQGAEATASSPSAWQNIVAAAKNEGTVVFYGVMSKPVMDRLTVDFQAAYPGLKLEYHRLTGGPLVTKIEQERTTGADGADVAVATERIWFEERARDGSIKAPAGPSAVSWPAEYMLSRAIPILALEGSTIVYNANLVKTPINGYADLLKPEFKGKITTQELVATVLVAWYDWLDKTQGADFVAKLADQQPRLYPAATAGLQSVAAGEVAIATFINSGFAVPMAKQMPNIRIVFPNPSFGFAYVGGAVEWSKRPNAAKVFMDYLMSARAQTLWHGQGDSASPLPNIPGSLNAKSIRPYDPAPYTPEVVKAFSARWAGMFKR